MKNRIFLIIFSILVSTNLLFAENILIESKNISIDKKNEVTIFENEVIVTTKDNNKIKSDYAEYSKISGIIILKKNIVAIDNKNNIIESDYAKFNDNTQILESLGPTKITTSEKYIIEGSDIKFNNNNSSIKSSKKSILTDQENNKIFLENFDYQTSNNIFKSIGYVKIIDKMNNTYEFSQIYIDTIKKEMLGTDIKSFANNDSLKINKNNKPRIFANTLRMNDEKSVFNKSTFTLCDYRKNDKCPPWTIQAKQMLHDNKKKTIYYDHAIIKVYNIPIFYFPKLSHPDPTVNRRSGFLPPSFSDTKNLGMGVTVPYFWALADDKNLTITSKLYADENPLILGEFHQSFKNSSLITDFGYTGGYKKTNSRKQAGDKSHFFSKFVKNFKSSDNSDNTLNIAVQEVSNDKYLKLYKIESNLVDYNSNTLETSVNFTREDENLFLGLDASIYETLKDDYDDKYEYILPEITIDKNLMSNNFLGDLDLQTKYKAHKYDTNKLTSFLINDFDWNYREISHSTGLKSKFLANIKNINYETKNVDVYKQETTAELYGAFGYLTSINLKKKSGATTHLLKPKMLLRYAPGSMRKETSGSKLDPINAFSLDRLNNINNFETGLNSTLGFDYKVTKNKKDFDFSVAQIINKKENKKMASETSLDEKLSDLVGSVNYEINENIDIKYNFNIDQNYNEFVQNEVGTVISYNQMKFDFNYLDENKHIGNQEYFKTKINYERSENGILSFETKRNLVTDSSEFYNLSYEYLNDCLRAGLVYRREFYTDSELEPEDSLMFKITLTPFGSISSPSFKQ